MAFLFAGAFFAADFPSPDAALAAGFFAGAFFLATDFFFAGALACFSAINSKATSRLTSSGFMSLGIVALTLSPFHVGSVAPLHHGDGPALGVLAQLRQRLRGGPLAPPCGLLCQDLDGAVHADG